LESSFSCTHRATMQGGGSISAIGVLLSGVWRRHVNYVYTHEMMWNVLRKPCWVSSGFAGTHATYLKECYCRHFSAISMLSLKCVWPLADGKWLMILVSLLQGCSFWSCQWHLHWSWWP
jgi:hypothetical protein